MKFLVIYEKSGTGWSAYVPDLPGVVTTGPTRETRRNLFAKPSSFTWKDFEKTICPSLNPLLPPKSLVFPEVTPFLSRIPVPTHTA
jgi:hypothetical protein